MKNKENNYTEKAKKRLEEKKEKQYQKELENLLFDAEKENTKKIPKLVNIILSLTMVITLSFVGFLIFDATEKENILYELINAGLILLIFIIFLIGFKRTYKYEKTKAISLSALLLIIIMTFNVLYLTNIITLPTQNTIPTFTGKTLTQALKWADKNNIKTEQTFEFSDKIKKYSIISQDIKPGVLTKKIKNINFEVSNGPDYNKEVVISDMTGWNIDDAVKVIDENILNNVTVNFEENLEIEKDIITSQDKNGTLKRNDPLTLTVSLGNKENLKEIKIKKLINKTLFKSTLYLNRNAIDYELKYDFSDKIDKGNVIKQSIKEGTKIKPGDKIILTISKGKKIVVPNLKNKKLSEVTKWIINNNLKISYSDKYDSKIKNGHVIDATYKKGDIIEEETVIAIIVSKGKLKMPKFKSLADFKTWADKYKIKYEIKEEFDDNVKKNDIIKFSIKTGKDIDEKEGIIVYVSKGKAVEIPNFIDQDKTSIQSICKKLNLNCTFNLEYNEKAKEGRAIKQSINKGEKVAEGTNIVITFATKNKNEVNKQTNTNKPNNNQNNSSNNNQSNNQTCSNYQLNLGYGGTGDQTKQIIIGQNPNLKFSWNPVNSCPNGDKEPGTICSSSASDGATVSSCDNIKITYVN